MNILKAIGALSSPAVQADRDGGDKKSVPDPPAAQPHDDGDERSNIMAQAMLRHERIANRVHSKKS